MDKCTDDNGCKSVNVDENQSPLECQLVANDRNDVDSYVDAPGFKHYDTGQFFFLANKLKKLPFLAAVYQPIQLQYTIINSI